jgi:copper(I)-binding protein
MRTLALFVAITAAVPALAHEFTSDQLAIGHPYAVATAATARTGAGYLSITNTGDAPDRLLEVRADFPSVQLHTTEVDAQGVARMRHVDVLEIPAGATVVLEPRGLHIMFLGLTAPLQAGGTIDATLVFETAGELPVVFNIEERGDAAPDHGEGHPAVQ